MRPASVDKQNHSTRSAETRDSGIAAGIALPSGSDLAHLLRKGLRRLAAAGRRRLPLLLTPILAMVPLSIALAFLMPRSFETSSLLLLQESNRNSPLVTDSVAPEMIQQKLPGLEALLKSDHVLTGAVSELQESGSRLVTGDLQRSIRNVREAISMDLIGTDFLVVRLRGPASHDLDRDLGTILNNFLEALLSEPATSASQMVLSRQEHYLADLELRRRDIQRRADSLRTADASGPGTTGNPRAYTELQRELASLEQQVAIARETYDSLSRRYPATNSGFGSGILSAPGRIKLVDPPKAPIPTASRLRFVLLTSLAGILLGIMLAWGAELLDPTIYDSDDLVAAAGLPLLAVLPASADRAPLRAPAAATARRKGRRVFLLLVIAAVIALSLHYAGLLTTVPQHWPAWTAAFGPHPTATEQNGAPSAPPGPVNDGNPVAPR